MISPGTVFPGDFGQTFKENTNLHNFLHKIEEEENFPTHFMEAILTLDENPRTCIKSKNKYKNKRNKNKATITMSQYPL